jgi:4-carboxymuconolactone decarboxylase
MTGDAPRIGNVPRAEWTEATREVFAFFGEPGAYENGSSKNMSMVLANHPDLAKAYYTFGWHVLRTTTIAVRPRELIVLRTAWHQQCAYEWHYHVGYGLSAGLTLEEIAAIRVGPNDPVWQGKPEDRAVLAAVDALVETSRIPDALWAELAGFMDKRQLMDLLFTIGNYVMLGWAAGAMGVPIEADQDVIGFDPKTRSGKPPAATLRPKERAG